MYTHILNRLILCGSILFSLSLHASPLDRLSDEQKSQTVANLKQLTENHYSRPVLSIQ